MKESKKSSKAENETQDIVKLILEDHKPLKEWIEVLKDKDATFSKKRPAFEKFAPALLAHAKSEQNSLYVALKEDKELRTEGLEGDTEHAIAEQLIAEIDDLDGDKDLWMAKVKVLAEVVEHHIEEEEDEMLKEVKKELSMEERQEIGMQYQELMSRNSAKRSAKASAQRESPAVHA